MEHNFFVVVLPGLEDLALEEFGHWYPDLAVEKLHGGLTTKAHMDVGLSFNERLKIPTRVLVRLTEFSCKDFPKLFKKIQDFAWEEWLPPGSLVKIEATSHRSRVKIKRRIVETASSAIEKRWKRIKVSSSETSDPALVFVRFVDNLCTVSLDTSGERLHKRGVRTHVGLAPLRETIASALLQWTFKHVPAAESVEVIDPMVGSGTFLLEGCSLKRLIAEDWVWIGYEQDQKTQAAAENNLAEVPSQRVHLRHGDLFQLKPLEKSAFRVVISNPPYGIRILLPESAEIFYPKLLQKVEEVFAPDISCFLFPSEKLKNRLKLPAFWRVLEKRTFSNGGVPVTAFIFKRESQKSEG